MAVDLS